ncbi:organic solute transporter Ostalpha-domain-containing protein [Cadophora sp. MPI-SDFR-AT-0126]|nr:organic solute transporter Ostalpha-domain-containing protein [Leotiomycetes sp. MPI-SDFR-AT-0126]
MGIFHDDGSKHNHTCPTPQYTDVEQVSVVGNLTFHQLIVIISGASLAFSCVVSFFLIFRHATHYSIPKEQKQIIRIVFMIPVFAACSFFSVAFNHAALYIKPIDDLYEAFALASFFLLLCAFIEENDAARQTFFTTSGTMKQYTAAAFGAFQFPVVMLILLVVTEITEAAGVTIMTLVSTVVAIMSILKFYKALKPRINHRKPLSKLVAFKGIVFLNFIQNAIISFLESSNDLKPTKHYTFHDLSVGIPNLLLSLEMVIFSVLFLYIYRTTEYCFKRGAAAVPLGHGGYQGGFLGLRAYREALNIIDILRGIASVPAAFVSRRSRRKIQGNWPANSQCKDITYLKGTSRMVMDIRFLELAIRQQSNPERRPAVFF